MRVVDADYLETERRIARAAAASDAEGIHAALAAAGYLPDPRAFAPERVLSQIRTAGEWYFTPGFRRLSPGYIADLMERSSSPRSDFYEEMRQETVPPQALLIRRMDGLVMAVLGELRAGGDWAALAAEYFDGRPPSYRRAAIHWVLSAKREETRERRLAQLIEDSAKGVDVKPLRRPERAA